MELFGISVTGPFPLGSVHLRVHHGVSVFYGLNGAGKTVLLNSIRWAFRGTAIADGAAHLYVRADQDELRQEPNSSEEDGGLARVLFDGFKETFHRVRDEFWGNEEFGSAQPKNLAEVVDVLTRLEFHEAEAYGGPVTSADLKDAIRTEIGRQGVFSISARGTEHSPVWEASPAVVVQDSDALREAVRLHDLTGGEGPIEFHVDLLQGGTIDLPPWVPVPIVATSRIDASDALGFRLIDERDIDLDDLTTEVVTIEPSRIRTIKEDGEVEWVPEFTDFLRNLSVEATAIAELLLLDAPTLECQVSHPEDWFRSQALSWKALDRPSLTWRPIDSLSSAQERWSKLAIWICLSHAAAVGASPKDFGLIAIDEPENALHTSAERDLVQGLHRLGEQLDWPIFVTTHSREFLNSSTALLHHVQRDGEGKTRVSVLETPLDVPSAELGVDQADLLQMFRTFLLVEGEHDRAVISTFLDRDLELARTGILSFRGTHNLMTLLDAQLLVEFTDAVFVIAVDRIRFPHLQDFWKKSQQSFASTGDITKAMRFLDPLRTASKEALIVFELCSRALRLRQPNRLAVFGFEKPDISHYVDVSLLVPGATDWQHLVDEWRSASTEMNFKSWLASEKESPITIESLTQAVRKMDSVPEDLVQLSELCRTFPKASN